MLYLIVREGFGNHTYRLLYISYCLDSSIHISIYPYIHIYTVFLIFSNDKDPESYNIDLLTYLLIQPHNQPISSRFPFRISRSKQMMH